MKSFFLIQNTIFSSPDGEVVEILILSRPETLRVRGGAEPPPSKTQYLLRIAIASHSQHDQRRELVRNYVPRPKLHKGIR